MVGGLGLRAYGWGFGVKYLLRIRDNFNGESSVESFWLRKKLQFPIRNRGTAKNVRGFC